MSQSPVRVIDPVEMVVEAAIVYVREKRLVRHSSSATLDKFFEAEKGLFKAVDRLSKEPPDTLKQQRPEGKQQD